MWPRCATSFSRLRRRSWLRRRRDRDRFERWREATELTDEERAAGLPVVPTFNERAVAASRPRRPPAETDRRAWAVSLSRGTHVRYALAWTAAAFALSAPLAYGVLVGNIAVILAGVVLLLFGLASAYIAFGIWWYVFTDKLRDPPAWLLRFGGALDRLLNTKLGR
jgi:hypothetical protein